MSGLNEIATTGAPVIVTALGMGTVFLCPTRLYLTTQAVGRWLPRLLGSAREAAPVEGVEFEERGGADAWKLDGRIRTLRVG